MDAQEGATIAQKTPEIVSILNLSIKTDALKYMEETEEVPPIA